MQALHVEKTHLGPLRSRAQGKVNRSRRWVDRMFGSVAAGASQKVLTQETSMEFLLVGHA